MEPNVVLQYLNKELKISDDLYRKLQQAKDVYYRISLHISGKRPRYRQIRGGILLASYVLPSGYDAEYDYIFENTIFSEHPNESPLSLQWRKANYREMTKAPFNQVINLISAAIFQDSNYTLEILDPEDREFIWGNSFHGYDLIGYFKNIGIKLIMEDPNGYFVRMPKYAYNNQPTSGKVPVNIHFVHSKDILVDPSYGVLVFKDGNYAWSIDQYAIWRYKLDESKKYIIDPDYKDGFYAHMLGRLPISKAGGEWNTGGYYDSYLVNAQAPADQFAASYSNKQLIDRDTSYTVVQEGDTDCPECHGKGQVQRDCDTCPMGIELVNCGVCGGSGTVSRNPGERLIVPKDKVNDTYFKFISPDVSPNKYHKENVEALYIMILEALLLRKTDKAESGEAKAIDQERLYQFISKISSHLFGTIIYDTLREISALRNVTNVNGTLQPASGLFTLVPPNQFQIKTAADLLDEFKTAGETNMPIHVMKAQIEDYVDKQFPGNDLLQKKNMVICALDDLCTRSVDDLLTMKTMGIVTPEELLYSKRLPQMIDDLIEQKGVEWFMEAELSDLKPLLPMPQAPQMVEPNMPLPNLVIEDVTRNNT